MKRYLLNILLALVCCAATWIVLELIDMKFSKNEYSFKYDHIMKHGSEISTLLLGNSYCYWGLNPEPLGDSCFNAATNARWIYFDRAILQNYLDEMPNLKVVIYPIGYKIPFCGIEHNEAPSLNRAPYIRYAHAKYMHIFYPDDKWKLWKYADWFGNDFVSLFTIKLQRPCDARGYEPHEGELSGTVWYEISQELIQTEHSKNSVEEYFRELGLMAQICNQNGILFVAVMTPVFPEQYKYIWPEQFEIVNEGIRQVQKKQPFEFYDFSHSELFEDSLLFSDYTHLNRKGGTLLAKVLNDTLKSN